MLGTVALTPRHLDDYTSVVGKQRVADLKQLAGPLRGLRMLSLSLAAFGSWLTDLLSTSTPLLQDLGIDAEWRVVRTDHEFERTTRALYEALNGAMGVWTQDLRRVWERYSAVNAALLEPRYDVIVVHDPQLLGMLPQQQPGGNSRQAHWIWRSHLDLSSAVPAVWEMLRTRAEHYDAAIFEDAAFVPPGWQAPIVRFFPPGIDPLGPRNVALDAATTAMLATKLGIDPARPLIAQISPLDAGSDALGLIEAYDVLLRRFPDLQLAIVPTSLRDDQATRGYFGRVAALANQRPGCILLSQVEEIGNTEINALQTAATVVVQKSLRKGFALWLSESMWKERPVVAGRIAGTVAQIQDGQTGYLVPDTAAFIDRTGALLADAALRRRMGADGRRYVEEHFLITRYLADALRVLANLVGAVRSR